MTGTIDLNADIGEAEDADGIASELAILRYVSSANIACGGHRGDAASMRRTTIAARDNGVAIGAHPSYPDYANFGRRSHVIGIDISADDLAKSLLFQIVQLCEIAASEDAVVSYVKPHGALYNDAVGSKIHADLIAGVIKRLDKNLIFMGGPNSAMERAADDADLSFIREGFIDRRYTDDGHLQDRSIDGAVIHDQAARMVQARSLAQHGTVITATGRTLSVNPQSLCLHGDSAGAVETARLARADIEAAGLRIKAFSDVRAFA
ncbi:LamB/YcsF family protein [Fretibacter rubidus]|uniref:LamB/YcsF family protein n=1 Tax=Fretibacter rubidus TaxID=570162 RepID=UPI00352ADFEF